MQEKLWKVIGFWSMGLILFVATMVIIRWSIDFATWSALDSGWAQAIGSSAALGVAIFIMSRQNQHSARLVLDSDKRAALRLASSVGALMNEASDRINHAADWLEQSAKASSDQAVAIIANMAKVTLAECKTSLMAIPAHELGNHDLVIGLIRIIECIKSLESVLTEIHQQKNFPREVIISRVTEVKNLAVIALENFQRGHAQLALS
jgi:hypothetical protein